MIGGLICECLGPSEVLALMISGLCLIVFAVLWFMR